MVCHEFKCGTGTSSRRVVVGERRYVVGALVQANYGVRDTLRIAGVPVGEHLREQRLYDEPQDSGSIIVVLATDAPLLPHQLERLARRAPLALGRMGSYAGNGSGDLFLAFSTANPQASQAVTATGLSALGNDELDPLFRGTVEAVEEAIVNALVAARDMTGHDGHRVVAIDHARLRDVLRRHGRLRDAR
jgi:D-aminopeptidase